MIPKYKLEHFRAQHRLEYNGVPFGNNRLDAGKAVKGFELYSSEGLKGSVGPLKSEFYRISITISGTLDMQIGVERYRHQPGTVSATYPNQILFKNNMSPDVFGYYMLFDHGFLDELLPAVKLPEEFPFFDFYGVPLFRLAPEELEQVENLVFKINDELQANRLGREKAIRMYLYLIMLEMKRSYERQELYIPGREQETPSLVSRFRRLVGQHYLTKRNVADYADLLAVTPNHLNRIVKETTNQTASATIHEMLVQEVRSLLRYTNLSVAEIAYKLEFSDPAAFNRFFKNTTGETPLAFRKKHDPVNAKHN